MSSSQIREDLQKMRPRETSQSPDLAAIIRKRDSIPTTVIQIQKLESEQHRQPIISLESSLSEEQSHDFKYAVEDVVNLQSSTFSRNYHQKETILAKNKIVKNYGTRAGADLEASISVQSKNFLNVQDNAVNNERSPNMRKAVDRYSYIRKNKNEAKKDQGQRFQPRSLSQHKRNNLTLGSQDGDSSCNEEDASTKKAVAQAIAAQKKAKKFNPEIYRFKNTDYDVQQESFKQSFYENGQANKTKINQQLVELTYIQILHRFGKEKKKGNFPTEFRQNEMKWAAQLMRSKKLQKIMAEYNERVAQVLEQELSGNDGLIKDWIAYPHSQSVSPSRNTMALSQLTGPIWFPERPPVSQQVQTVYNRQHAHLAKLSVANKKKKEEEIERIVKLKEDVSLKVKITEQVLARMASKKSKRSQKSKEPVKPVMTPFCEAIHERLQVANQKINDFEQLDFAFQEELEAVESSFEKSGLQKAGRNPGIALKNLLTKWSEEPIFTTEDNEKFQKELWLSLAQFEQFLKEQNFGIELENKALKKSFRTRVDGIRAQTSFRIEALESALTEVKLKLMRERERADMRLAEMESVLFNQHMDVSTDELERVTLAETTLADPQFQDIDDAKKVKLLERSVRRLAASIRGCMQEKIQFKKEINELKYIVETNKEFNDKVQNNAHEDKEIVLYYQQILYEILESTGIMTNVGEDSPLSEEKQLALKEIFELNQERLQKDKEQDSLSEKKDDKKKVNRLAKFVQDFHDVILTVDFRSLFTFYMKVGVKKEETITKMADEFLQLGLIIEEGTVAIRKHQTMPTTQQQMGGLEVNHANITLAKFPRDSSKYVLPTRSTKGSTRALPMKKASKIKLGQISAADDDNDQTLGSPTSQFQQHIFRMNDSKLQQIRQQFDFLALPTPDGIVQMMKLQEQKENEEKAIQAALDSAGAQVKYYDEVSKPGALGLDSSVIEGKRKKTLSTKKGGSFVQQLKNKQAKRLDVAEKKDKKAHKLAEKKSQENKISNKSSRANLRKSSRVPPKSNRQQSNISMVSKHGGTGAGTVKDDSKVQLHENGEDQKDDEGKSDFSSQISEVDSVSNTSKNRSNNHSRKSGSEMRNKIQVGSLDHKNSSKQISNKEQRQGVSPSSRNLNSSRSKRQHAKENNLDEPSDKQGDQTPKRDGMQEGFDSDIIITEPLDRTQEVLAELEGKILLKYKVELEAVENADEATFKLKAAQNKWLSQAFQNSLGTKLETIDDTALMMIGNLPEFIEKLNNTQQKYLRPDNVVEAPVLQRQMSIDCEKPIPLTDCIIADIDNEGELKGFKIRPEVAKFLMWRQEGKNQFTQIHQVIRTVNFLNRLMFKPDYYMLGIKLPGEEIQFTGDDLETNKRVDHDVKAKSVKDDLLDKSDTEKPDVAQSIELTGNAGALVELLISHSSAIIAKGNLMKQRYQTRMFRDLNLEELLQYKLPQVFESLTVEQRSEVSTNINSSGNLSYLQYLQILLKNLESKLTAHFSPEQVEPLSIEDLVFQGRNEEGSGNGQKSEDQAGSALEPRFQSSVEMHTQTNESGPARVAATPKKKQERVSKYSIQALGATQDKRVGTTDELLQEYVRNNQHLGGSTTTDHIDKAVGEEMSRTISTLNEFVSRMQTSPRKVEMYSKAKDQKTTSLFESQSKSIATQMSSNSPFSNDQFGGAANHGESALSPIEQLRAIRARIENNSEMVDETIRLTDGRNQQDKYKVLRTAEMAGRVKHKQKDTTGNLQQLNCLASKLPRLSHAQNIHSERNYSYTQAGSGRKINPLLHNESQKVPSFLHQPFKQVHRDKKINNDSTASKFSHIGQMNHTMHSRPSSSGLNPPGLVAKKLLNVQPSTERSIKVNQSVQISDFPVNNSLDCKDFGNNRRLYDTGPEMRKNSNLNASFHGGVNVIGNKDSKRNHRAMILTSQSVEGSDNQMQLFSPSEKSSLNASIAKNMQRNVVPASNLGHLRISESKETMRESSKYHNFLSAPSPQQQAHMQLNSSRDHRVRLEDIDLPKKTGVQKYITIEPLSSGDRKTSTTMTWNKNGGDDELDQFRR